MVAQATLRKLQSDVDALAFRLSNRPEVVSIGCPVGWDFETVRTRHEQIFPEDREPKLTVVLKVFSAEGPFNSDHRADAAWQAIAREQKGKAHDRR